MGNEVKLRAQPSTSAEIVILLNEGATLQITAKRATGTKSSSVSSTAGVHKDYVFEVSETGLNGTILRDGINLRDGSSLFGQCDYHIGCWNRVQVTDYQSGWHGQLQWTVRLCAKGLHHGNRRVYRRDGYHACSRAA